MQTQRKKILLHGYYLEPQILHFILIVKMKIHSIISTTCKSNLQDADDEF